MHDDELTAFLDALDALPAGQLVPFTGWAMSVEQLRTHARSELVLHRWDLVGDDDSSARLLDQPVLIAHGRAVLAAMPTLAEARRAPRADDDLLSLWGRVRDAWRPTGARASRLPGGSGDGVPVGQGLRIHRRSSAAPRRGTA